MQHGDDMDPRDPLAAAIEQGDGDAVADLLSAAPRMLHTHTPMMRPWGEEMWLPLHRAALAGRPAVVTLLLDHGAQPDSRTRYLAGPEHGRATALHLAAAADRAAVVQVLLDAGADVEVRDAGHRSPLQLSAPGSAAAQALQDAGAEGEPAGERERYADLL